MSDIVLGDMRADQRGYRNLLLVLVSGFTLVIICLLVAGFMGVQNVRSIQDSAAGLVKEQLLTARLIDGLQREQKTLSTVFYDLASTPDRFDPSIVRSQLDESDRTMRDIVEQARRTGDDGNWDALKNAALAFSAEVRYLLDEKQPEVKASENLLRRHQEVVSLTARLLGGVFRKASQAQRQIESRSAELVRESVLLLSLSLGCALACALYTVRLSSRMYRQMERQSNELSRVSWHLLENQETTARRFSHELHDELGQSLTAVKANLLALEAGSSLDRRRLTDTRQLVDEAVRNVRELSQLLRPVILDDLGLDAGLRSLAEGFMQRTGIEVEYKSNFDGRLQDETETHLFRIAQEALTNVARHSGATRVQMELKRQPDQIQLMLRDNGRGLRSKEATSKGLGMIGMRARARSAGGDFRVESSDAGVVVRISVPCHSEQIVHDPHLVGG